MFADDQLTEVNFKLDMLITVVGNRNQVGLNLYYCFAGLLLFHQIHGASIAQKPIKCKKQAVFAEIEMEKTLVAQLKSEIESKQVVFEYINYKLVVCFRFHQSFLALAT